MSVNYIDKSTGDLIRVAGGGNDILYADAPIGSIIPYGGTTAPNGFLLCQGQAISRTTYAELFAVIGTSFGSGNGSTTFNVPDLREATTKGVGLSGKSSDHFDSDGVALGEFVEDRVQAHTHSHKIGSSTAGSEDWVMFATSQVLTGINQTDYGVVGRFGNTTEVKAVGVNYIIKAKQVDAPADFMDAVDEAIAELFANDVGKTFFTPTPSSGSVVTSDCWYIRKGNVVTVNIGIASMTASSPGEVIFTLPVGLRPCGQRVLHTGNNNNYAAECNIQISQNGNISVVCNSGCFGTITYVTE